MSRETKLTAEQIERLEKVIKSNCKWVVDQSPNDKYHEVQTHSSMYKDIERCILQQTASLQEEIERLKKEKEDSHREYLLCRSTLRDYESQLSESQKEVKQLTEALEFALGIKELWSANAKYINYSEEHKNEAEALLKMESMFNQLLKKGE